MLFKISFFLTESKSISQKASITKNQQSNGQLSEGDVGGKTQRSDIHRDACAVVVAKLCGWLRALEQNEDVL